MTTPANPHGTKEDDQAQWRGCNVPPEGWWCSRAEGHGGPCAARPGLAPIIAAALQTWRELPDDERNGERPFIMGFNAGWEEALNAEAAPMTEVGTKEDTDMETLLPCPFCGCEPALLPADPATEGDAWNEVRCDQCMVGPSFRINDDDPDYRMNVIADAWNTRLNAERPSSPTEMRGGAKQRAIQLIRDLVVELETWEPELVEVFRFTAEAKLMREWLSRAAGGRENG